jgi:hypothetical protein
MVAQRCVGVVIRDGHRGACRPWDGQRRMDWRASDAGRCVRYDLCAGEFADDGVVLHSYIYQVHGCDTSDLAADSATRGVNAVLRNEYTGDSPRAQVHFSALHSVASVVRVRGMRQSELVRR